MENFKRQLDCLLVKLDYITVTKFWDTSGQTDIGNKEIDLRIKNLLSSENILNNRQIAADIEEKLANQGEVLRGGISRIYLSLSNKWKPWHRAINSWPRNLRTALEKHFRYQWNCKQQRIAKLPKL